MTLEDLLKTTEGLVVIVGCLLALFAGKFWIIATLIAYILLNVPSLFRWIKDKVSRS